MQLEALRMCHAAAEDPTIGVNAMLAVLPVDGIDQRPREYTIYNSADEGCVARRSVPAEGSGLIFPALAIYIPTSMELEPVSTTIRDGHIDINFSHLDLEADTPKGNRDAYYGMRAVGRFLTRFVRNDAGVLRTRGGVILMTMTSAVQSPDFHKWEHGIVQQTMKTTWRIRETEA